MDPGSRAGNGEGSGCRLSKPTGTRQQTPKGTGALWGAQHDPIAPGSPRTARRAAGGLEEARRCKRLLTTLT